MLAWAVVGLCLTRTVRLTAWAEVVEGCATYAASRVRRFARWLHHPCQVMDLAGARTEQLYKMKK
jgi:hypothetical protein